MPLPLLVVSPSSYKMMKKIVDSSSYKFLVIDKALNKVPKKYPGKVTAIGGGAVIDAAKLLAGDKPCFACPMNASGASSTSHAVIWTKTQKIDVKTPVPILNDDYKNLPIKLSDLAIQRTMFDCNCHILESKFSIKANWQSLEYCRLAEIQMGKWLAKGNVTNLIEAGNLAGMAIEITGTNFIHSISYVLTLQYGYCHGDALKEALQIRKRPDFQRIIDKAAKNYPKFYESRLL